MIVLSDKKEQLLRDIRASALSCEHHCSDTEAVHEFCRIAHDITRVLTERKLNDPDSVSVRIPVEFDVAYDEDNCRVYLEDLDVTDILPHDIYAQCAREAWQSESDYLADAIVKRREEE